MRLEDREGRLILTLPGNGATLITKRVACVPSFHFLNANIGDIYRGR